MANTAVVIAKGDNQHPVNQVLNAPVRTQGSEKQFGVDRLVGDEVSSLRRGTVWKFPLFFDPDQTLELRPSLVRIHVGKAFGVRDDPAALGFDTTLPLIDRLVEVVKDIGKLVVPLQPEHGPDIIMQLSLILFECQDIFGAARVNLLCNQFLTADGVE